MNRLRLIPVIVVLVFVIAGCGIWDSPFGDPRPYIVGEWTFDDDNDRDETYDIVWDSSGWFHDGIVEKGQWVPGVPKLFGYALKIEEADNAVRIEFTSRLQPTGSLTVESWIKPDEDLVIDGSDTVYPIIVADNVYALSWDSSRGLTFTIYQEDGEDKVYAADKLGGEDLVIEKDSWTHVAVVMETNFYKLNLYVDGKTAKSFTDESIRRSDLWNMPGDYIYLGKSKDGDVFLGCLDNARIYNTAVSQSWLGYYADDLWFKIIYD